ncbi:MAG: hypothetical protein AB7N99_01900 [Simkaniaceae bacterium]
MTYEGRALYNLLQMNLKQNPDLEVEPWQVEIYRDLPEEELFSRLESHQIFLDKDNFLLYVDACESPEDLADCLYLEEDYAKHEQVYLCVFELWRRLATHKQSLSIFVDQLDHLIEEYEEGKLENDEELQTSLESFQIILDDNVDEGGDPRDGYYFFSSYSCHDLEVFIYEYVSHQIDIENDLYASELLEGFFPYVDNKRWFELLRIRLVSAADVAGGNVMVQRLLESLKEEPELYLLFETLHFLIYVGENDQFIATFNRALEQLETEEDLRELLMLTAEYLESINKEKEVEVINDLIDQQKDKNLQDPLNPEDYALQILKDIMNFSSV